MELLKNTTSYKLFWTNLGSSTQETSTVQPLTCHLKNHPNKTNKTCGTDGEARTNSLLIFFYWSVHAGRPARSYLHQLCVDIGCGLEDLPGVMAYRDRWRMSVREIGAVSMNWWWWWWYEDHSINKWNSEFFFPESFLRKVNCTLFRVS